MPNSIGLTVWKYTQALGIKLSKNLISRVISRHPEFPSILSITDGLDSLGIESIALEVEKENVGKLPLPFLAHLNREGGQLALINSRKELMNPESNFNKYWSGVVVAAEKPATFDNKLNEEILQSEKKNQRLFINITLSLFAISILSITNIPDKSLIGFVYTALIGFYLTIIVILKQFGALERITSVFCQAGQAFSCEETLQSNKEFKIAGFTLSDMSLIFFATQWILAIYSCFSPSAQIQILSIFKSLSILSLPVIIFSLVYQWKVTKKWCFLCLGISSILLLQFSIMVANKSVFLTALNLNTVFATAILLFLSSQVWFAFKQHVKKYREAEIELNQNLRFRNNMNIFLKLLEREKKLPVANLAAEIEIGNEEGQIKIEMVCNPYCSPCSKAHEIMDTLIEKYGDRMSVKVIFLVDASAHEDKRTIAAAKIFNLIFNGNESSVKNNREIIKNWFKVMDMDKFNEIYPISTNYDTGLHLSEHDLWCEKQRITSTPTFIIGNKIMPEEYSYFDMPGIIKSLVDN